MTYVIAQPCVDVKDKSCIEECPVDCIYEGTRMLYIQPDECVDCGACEPVCPVEAIYYEDDVPGEWKQFGDINEAAIAGVIMLLKMTRVEWKTTSSNISFSLRREWLF